MHLIERRGSRAGTRSKLLGRAAGISLTTPAESSTYSGVVDCPLVGTAAATFEDGESIVVRGVRYVFEFLTEDMALCCVEALNSDELVLA